MVAQNARARDDRRGQRPRVAAWRSISTGRADTSEYVRQSGSWNKPGGTFSACLIAANVIANATTPYTNGAQWSQDNQLAGASWSNGIKVGASGLYLINFSASVAQSVLLYLAIKKNNIQPNNTGAIIDQYLHNTGGVAPMGGAITRIVSLAANDVLTPVIYTPNAGGPWALQPTLTSFSVSRV